MNCGVWWSSLALIFPFGGGCHTRLHHAARAAHGDTARHAAAPCSAVSVGVGRCRSVQLQTGMHGQRNKPKKQESKQATAPEAIEPHSLRRKEELRAPICVPMLLWLQRLSKRRRLLFEMLTRLAGSTPPNARTRSVGGHDHHLPSIHLHHAPHRPTHTPCTARAEYDGPCRSTTEENEDEDDGTAIIQQHHAPRPAPPRRRPGRALLLLRGHGPTHLGHSVAAKPGQRRQRHARVQGHAG